MYQESKFKRETGWGVATSAGSNIRVGTIDADQQPEFVELLTNCSSYFVSVLCSFFLLLYEVYKCLVCGIAVFPKVGTDYEPLVQ